MSDNETPICADLDGDCEDLDHLHCWLYDPIKGRCPYLSRKPTRTPELTARTSPARSPNEDTT